jgi:hypothetical protein
MKTNLAIRHHAPDDLGHVLCWFSIHTLTPISDAGAMIVRAHNQVAQAC